MANKDNKQDKEESEEDKQDKEKSEEPEEQKVEEDVFHDHHKFADTFEQSPTSPSLSSQNQTENNLEQRTGPSFPTREQETKEEERPYTPGTAVNAPDYTSPTEQRGAIESGGRVVGGQTTFDNPAVRWAHNSASGADREYETREVESRDLGPRDPFKIRQDREKIERRKYEDM